MCCVGLWRVGTYAVLYEGRRGKPVATLSMVAVVVAVVVVCVLVSSHLEAEKGRRSTVGGEIRRMTK